MTLRGRAGAHGLSSGKQKSGRLTSPLIGWRSTRSQAPSRAAEPGELLFMDRPNYFLQVELSEDKQEVTVNGCPVGLRMLANELHKLAAEVEARGTLQTQNYFSPDWCGFDLETRRVHPDQASARSFCLRAWPSAAFAQQFLHEDTQGEGPAIGC